MIYLFKNMISNTPNSNKEIRLLLDILGINKSNGAR